MRAKRALYTGIMSLTGIVLFLGVTAPAVAQDWKTIDDASWCNKHSSADRDRHCEIRETTIPAGSGIISIDGHKNGGIRVEGWSRNEIQIRAKVQAWDRDGEDALALAREIEITAGQTIRARGPEARERHRGWSVSFELMVPHRSDLSLETVNGGISITDVDGRMRFDATNGGITLERVAGDVSGRTTNGGVNVDLDGTSWSGEGLDVRTTNGGVRLVIPENYNADLTVGTTNGNISIDFPVMVQGEIKKRLETKLGSGGPPVHVVTTNGGVKIKKS